MDEQTVRSPGPWIDVVRGGLLTTVQDRGRLGWRRQGVPRSGSLDLEEAEAANGLVGNDPDAALLEATIDGPTLRFPHGGVVALCGADIDAYVGGRALPMRRALLLGRGATLQTCHVRRGCRTYVAVGGGIDVPVLLGSRSTCLRAGFGGFAGRAIRAYDRLPVGAPTIQSSRVAELLGVVEDGGACIGSWRAREPNRTGPIDVTPEAEYALLDSVSRSRFLTEDFLVSESSDRMGLRLHCTPLTMSVPTTIASRAVLPGTIQLPPDGQPLILLADGGTTGGYPVIASVHRKALSRLAQVWVGDALRFRESR